MNNKEICFYIENKTLYLEHILVDYENIPIFFLCKGEKQYYIVLCTDIQDFIYVVSELSVIDVYNLLHGKIPMRDAILQSATYWEVTSGEEPYSDIVIKKNINLLDRLLLPEENACFEILTKEMQLYVQKFDQELFNPQNFSKNIREVNISNESFDNDAKYYLMIKNISYSKKLFSIPFVYNPRNQVSMDYTFDFNLEDTKIKLIKYGKITTDEAYNSCETMASDIALIA